MSPIGSSRLELNSGYFSDRIMPYVGWARWHVKSDYSPKDRHWCLRIALIRKIRLTAWFHDTKLAPKDVDPLLAEAGSGPLSGPVRAVELLRRPRVRAEDLLSVGAAQRLMA